MNFQNQAVTVASATTAATNMTTILQKNCLKTLSGNNSVVVVANGSLATGNLSGIAPTTSTTFLTGQPVVNFVTTGGGTTTTRMLLPHELGSITSASYAPISSASSTINSTQSQQQLHQTFQYHNQQQQFLVYNHNNDVTMYRPINTTLYHSHEQHLNNQQTQQQQHQFLTQQHSIPKPLINAVHFANHIAPTTSNYQHIENGYTGTVTNYFYLKTSSCNGIINPHMQH